MTLQIRNITPEELPSMAVAIRSAFGAPRPLDNLERFAAVLELDRTFCCFEDATMVATSANFSFDMTVPGATAGCAGVTMVSVAPTHRRQGLLNRMMRALVDDARDRGEPLAALFASEEAIYPRYGFGLAADQGNVDIEAPRMRFFDEAPSGATRLIEHDEALAALPPIYNRVRTAVPGMLSRTSDWWRSHRLGEASGPGEGGSPLRHAVWSGSGGDDGYVLYTQHAAWSRGGTSEMRVVVDELVGATPDALRALWGYVLSIDLAEKVEAWYLPSDLPLRLMVTEPRRLRFAKSESLWLRLVEAETALNARSYGPGGSVVIELSDSFCPWNEGRYRISPEGATRTEDAPGVRIDAASLAAAYLGEFTFNELARARRCEVLNPAALDEADRLFWTARSPWCPENF